MGWSIEGCYNMNRLIEYEKEINYMFPRSRSAFLCQYSEKLFNEEVLAGIIRTHPRVAIYGKIYDNPFYVEPGEFSRRIEEKDFLSGYERMRDSIIKGAA